MIDEQFREAAVSGGGEPQWAEILAAHAEPFDASNDSALRALLQQPPTDGRAGKLVSRRVRNLRVNWQKAIESALKIGGGPALTTLAHGLNVVLVSGTGFPLAAAVTALLGLLLSWRAVSGLLDVDLSAGHAKILYLLWLNRDRNVTMEDVHAILDAELGSENVSSLLTDLSDLGLIRFGIGRVELLDEVVLTES